jgi:hypothetical protein
MEHPPYIVPPQRPDAQGQERHDAGDDHGVVPPRPDHECERSTHVSGMMRAMRALILAVVTAVCLVPAVVGAAPAKKKYHFELTKVLVKDNVKPDVAKEARPRVEEIFKKALDEHPQLVSDVTGAPDPESSMGQPYRKFLAKKGIAAAFLVTVEVTEADIEIVPMEDKKNSQRIVVSVGIHVLGETIPGRTMGFTGDGRATVKQEVGMKIRDKDREFAWDDAAKTAVDQALEKCFAELAKPPAPPPKKPAKKK